MAMFQRLGLAAMAALFFAAIAGAQDLKITGSNVRTVVVVDALPIKIEAPPGGFLYRWTFSTTISATKDRNVLTITAAPKGALTVSVEWVIYNAKLDPPIDEKSASVTFSIGDVPGPSPPVPVPPSPSADNPFVAAWKLEANPKKATYAAVVAALYRGYAKESQTIQSGKALFDFMSAAYLAAETGGEKIQGKMPTLVTAVNAWLAANLKTPEGALAATDRTAAESAFLKIANWLGELQ